MQVPPGPQYMFPSPLAMSLWPGVVLWKAVVDVPCNLQRVVINLQRVVDINQ